MSTYLVTPQQSSHSGRGSQHHSCKLGPGAPERGDEGASERRGRWGQGVAPRGRGTGQGRGVWGTPGSVGGARTCGEWVVGRPAEEGGPIGVCSHTSPRGIVLDLGCMVLRAELRRLPSPQSGGHIEIMSSWPLCNIFTCVHVHIHRIKKKINVPLCGCAGSWLQPVGSLAGAYKLLVAECEI